MLIVRWSLMARFGMVEDCLSILKKWEIDVGERVGWKLGSIGIRQAVFATSDAEVELEARCESLAELENTWADMERVPYHREYIKMLERVVVPGSSRWTVFKEIAVHPAG